MPAPSSGVKTLWDSGAFVTHVDALIERPSGAESVLQSYRTFGGINWIKALRLERASAEQPIGSGTLTLHRQVGAQSLSPLVTTSPLNLDGGVYAPANDFGREITIRTCNLPKNTEPVSGDWITVFQGFTDDPEFGGKSGDLQISFRDRSGPLADTYIRRKITYGATSGVDAVTVMQAILDEWMGLGQYDLQDWVSGARFMVTNYTPYDVSVWEALQAIALMWGGKALRQEKDGSGEFQLTVVDPDRDKTAVDYSIGAGTYIEIPNLSTGGANFRTIVKGMTTDGITGAILSSQIPAEDDVATDPLVLKYGQRTLSFAEDSAKGIDSQPELDDMVAAAYADVSALTFPMDVETKYCPWAHVDDVVSWGANAVLFDQAQVGAVLRLTDEFSDHGKARTRWRMSERPVGALSEWTHRDVRISGVGAVEPQPGFASLGTPVPLYTSAVGAQGWRWEGAVLKDTNGLFVGISGDISADVFSPTAYAVTGGWWLDMSATKSFDLTFRQSAGQVGTITLIAFSSPSDTNRGLESEPQAQTLRLDPLTLMEAAFVSPTVRLLTFTTKPVGATLKYRIGGSGAWTSVATSTSAPAVKVTLTITGGRVLVEWQAVLGTYEEEPQKQYFDVDDLPAVGPMLAIEQPAGQLTYSVTRDDDVVSGELYARPGSRPVDASGNPDPVYIISTRFSGVYSLASATWYLLFRGYDVFRRTADVEATVTIVGTPSSTATLSNPRASLVSNHPELRWSHNSAAIGHKIVILRDGVTVLALATGRLVQTDPDGSDVTALEGGWTDTSLTSVAAGTTGAILKTVKYELRWYTSGGVFVNALSVPNLSFYVVGTSDTGPPTEIPSSPFAELLTGTSARGSWDNTSSAWTVRVRWYKGGVLTATHDLPAGATFDDVAGVSGEHWKFKVSYLNSSGEGTQTAFSNEVTMFGL